MKIAISFLWCLLLSLISRQTYGQYYDSAFGKPLIVLTITDPWRIVIGSDVPTFVLYEKGQVMYTVINNKELEIYQCKLSQKEIRNLIESFSISDAFYKLKEHYEAARVTDEGTTTIKIKLKKSKTVSVYGCLNGKDIARNYTPEEFLIVYDNITTVQP